MPRTTITPTTLPGASYGVGFQEFTWTAGDAGNNNAFASTGKELLLIRNVNAASPGVSRKVTIQKTFGKVEYTLGAGEYACTGQIPTSGWRQNDNSIYVDPEHADLEFAVLILP